MVAEAIAFIMEAPVITEVPIAPVITEANSQLREVVSLVPGIPLPALDVEMEKVPMNAPVMMDVNSQLREVIPEVPQTAPMDVEME